MVAFATANAIKIKRRVSEVRCFIPSFNVAAQFGDANISREAGAPAGLVCAVTGLGLSDPFGISIAASTISWPLHLFVLCLRYITSRSTG
jgi:hypothetical protein